MVGKIILISEQMSLNGQIWLVSESEFRILYMKHIYYIEI